MRVSEPVAEVHDDASTVPEPEKPRPLEIRCGRCGFHQTVGAGVFREVGQEAAEKVDVAFRAERGRAAAHLFLGMIPEANRRLPQARVLQELGGDAMAAAFAEGLLALLLKPGEVA
jgi:hypothetical protein